MVEAFSCRASNSASRHMRIRLSEWRTLIDSVVRQQVAQALVDRLAEEKAEALTAEQEAVAAAWQVRAPP